MLNHWAQTTALGLWKSKVLNHFCFFFLSDFCGYDLILSRRNPAPVDERPPILYRRSLSSFDITLTDGRFTLNMLPPRFFFVDVLVCSLSGWRLGAGEACMSGCFSGELRLELKMLGLFGSKELELIYYLPFLLLRRAIVPGVSY